MIHEILNKGQSGAVTMEHLAKVLNISTREFRKQVDIERRAGFPICASCIEPYGFYLADNADELRAYIKMMDHRADEARKTRVAMMNQLSRFNGEKTEMKTI